MFLTAENAKYAGKTFFNLGAFVVNLYFLWECQSVGVGGKGGTRSCTPQGRFAKQIGPTSAEEKRYFFYVWGDLGWLGRPDGRIPLRVNLDASETSAARESALARFIGRRP
jgi:hypothetical protein